MSSISPFFAFLVVLQVVQSAGVGSGCDDRRVSELASSAYEFAGVFSFDLKFLHSGFDHSKHLSKAAVGHVDGFLDHFNFKWILDEP
jgi:hypothetical protein